MLVLTSNARDSTGMKSVFMIMITDCTFPYMIDSTIMIIISINMTRHFQRASLGMYGIASPVSISTCNQPGYRLHAGPAWFLPFLYLPDNKVSMVAPSITPSACARGKASLVPRPS